MHPCYPLPVQGGEAPPVRLECKMHTDCWIQQVTTRVGAVTCWIQQPVSPKQVVGFTCVLNSEIDQLIRNSSVRLPLRWAGLFFQKKLMLSGLRQRTSRCLKSLFSAENGARQHNDPLLEVVQRNPGEAVWFHLWQI